MVEHSLSELGAVVHMEDGAVGVSEDPRGVHELLPGLRRGAGGAAGGQWCRRAFLVLLQVRERIELHVSSASHSALVSKNLSEYNF